MQCAIKSSIIAGQPPLLFFNEKSCSSCLIINVYIMPQKYTTGIPYKTRWCWKSVRLIMNITLYKQYICLDIRNFHVNIDEERKSQRGHEAFVTYCNWNLYTRDLLSLCLICLHVHITYIHISIELYTCFIVCLIMQVNTSSCTTTQRLYYVAYTKRNVILLQLVCNYLRPQEMLAFLAQKNSFTRLAYKYCTFF